MTKTVYEKTKTKKTQGTPPVKNSPVGEDCKVSHLRRPKLSHWQKSETQHNRTQVKIWQVFPLVTVGSLHQETCILVVIF